MRPARHTLAGTLLAVAALALALTLAPAAADGATFVAEVDRQAVGPGDPFVYEVTLTVANENVDDFHPPDFKGLQVLNAPQFPGRSTSMQIGGGQTMVQNGYSWRYELMVPAGQKGPITIGPARARVAGREVRSNPVTVRLWGAGGAPPPGRQGPRVRGGLPFDPFADMLRGGEPPAASPAGPAFLRAVADKTRAYEGEQVTVSWYLYVTQRPDKFQPITEARTDGFWSEEIPSTAPKGRLLFTPGVMVVSVPFQLASSDRLAAEVERPAAGSVRRGSFRSKSS